MTSCKYTSMTRVDSHRPLRLQSSGSSVVNSKCVAPPGRNDPRSKPLQTFVDSGKLNDLRTDANLFLSVAAEKGHKGLSAGSSPKTPDISWIMSIGSIRAAWCFAALPRVFGALMRNKMKFTPGIESCVRCRSTPMQKLQLPKAIPTTNM